MKKIIFSVILLTLSMILLGLDSQAYNQKQEQIIYQSNATTVEKYELNGTEFRGAWVSSFASDIKGYTTPLGWRGEVGTLINVFKQYNLNTMIFHIRTHNNAMYDSKLNPVSIWWEGANFEEYDPLEYLITECHKAGIEFHAWMNPYRISTKTSDINVASKEGQYLGEALPKVNPASDPANLIAGSGGVILNPGLPNVRDFIVDTCMEVIENYDVDAIHFDDYFYISGTEDTKTYQKYNPKGLSVADWRREQVNLFIEQLHDAMTEYNLENNKAVQLGISPSGIYKNGNGSTNPDDPNFGSNTRGFAHYGDYLYSDTYKWAKEGWIDYLLPQSYWGFTHPVAGYQSVMGWWNDVFEGLDCLLYSGIGLYMSDSSTSYSWSSNPHELAEQITYLTTLKNVSGYSIYKYSWIKEAYSGESSAPAKQVNNALKAGCFKDVALYPVIDNMTEIKLGKVEELIIKDNKLTWKHNPNAKAYAIYRSDKDLTYSNDEIVALVGGTDDIVTWKDSLKGDYKYGVRLISRTNTLGEVNEESFKVTFLNETGDILSEQIVTKGATAAVPRDPKKEGYTFVGWDTDFSNVQSDLIVKPIFEENKIETPDEPEISDTPVVPDEPKSGCKKDLTFVVIGFVSIITASIIILKKDR